jgi:single-stranded DNA-binding protein
MTAHVLIQGALFRQPERKTSTNGRPFVQATVKIKDGAASTFWRIFAFSESVQEELLRLSEGDALSVSGPMRAEMWAPEGKEPRIALSLTADAILPLRREKQPREKRAADTLAKSAVRAIGSSITRRPRGRVSPFAPHGAHPTDSALDDDIPF